uniref:Uncharacterized protein n=1 Tax=Arundo donax TaxID=35708 RepID=A0A0A9AFL5_ARUDO
MTLAPTEMQLIHARSHACRAPANPRPKPGVD